MRASVPARATHWPRPLRSADYEAVRRDYVDRLVATGEVKAVYQMGSVAAPGLSDLDLLVVLNDELAADVNSAADIGAGGETARYVLMHSQFLMNEAVFSDLEALFVASDLRRVHGARLDRAPLPEDEARVLRLVFNVEMILSTLSRLVRLCDESAVFPVRPTLAALHGLRFNVFLAREWVRCDSDLPDEVTALREEWFDLDREEAWARIARLVPSAVDVLGGLLDQLRPPAATLCGGGIEGSVRTLEIHEVQRYGPWPFRATAGRRMLPGLARRSRRLAEHLLPLLELKVPSAYFGFFALEAEEFRRLGALSLARRVTGDAPRHAAPVLRRAIRRRAEQVVALRRFAERNRIRRSSWPVPLLWQRPYPWKYRLKARLLEAVGVGS